MSLRSKTIVLVAALTVAASPAFADDIVRDAALIETVEIEGVTLAMSPQEALEHLLASGYSAGDITSFDAWDGYNISLVRGSYTEPQGESWVSLDRRGGRLVAISESFNRTRGDLFEPDEEIGAVQSHFSIAADDPKCHVNDFNTGSCEVRDAADDEDVDLVFSMTAQATMIMRSASRTQQLGFE
ncbi:MAG: hypothetical protein PVI23_12660 [Maricaulaceae bacterium]|jgi:hypothetical protein